MNFVKVVIQLLLFQLLLSCYCYLNEKQEIKKERKTKYISECFVKGIMSYRLSEINICL